MRLAAAGERYRGFLASGPRKLVRYSRMSARSPGDTFSPYPAISSMVSFQPSRVSPAASNTMSRSWHDPHARATTSLFGPTGSHAAPAPKDNRDTPITPHISPVLLIPNVSNAEEGAKNGTPILVSS